MYVKLKNLLSSLHLVVLLSVAFLVVLFCYLILRSHHLRLDLSKGNVYSLSVASIQTLEALRDEPIRAVGFFRDNHPLKQEVKELFEEYAYHHPNFKYVFYDPDRMPAKARAYQVDAYETIVLEVKGKREKTKLLTEEAITNLLARLYRDELKSIYFAVGHEEPSLADADTTASYTLLRDRLTDANYEVKETVLLRQGLPEEGVHLLVVGGPRVDLLPEELVVIRKYLASGGRLLVMIDPVNKGEGKNMMSFLREYGITLGEDIVVDKLSKLFGGDYLIPIVTDYRAHAITKGFQLASFFPLARTVKKAENAPEGFEISELAWTGTGSWAEKNLTKLEGGVVDFNETEDTVGPVPIAIAVEHPEQEWRIVVVGDSDFVTNTYLNLSGNKDFILNVCAWLTGDEFQIAIRPREREATPLFLREVDQQFLFYVPVMGLPILSLVTGTGVFFWRRRYN